MIRRGPCVALTVGVVGLAVAAAASAGDISTDSPRNGPTKRLIEFGWDEPDTAFLRVNREQLEQSPFDGCVFHVTTRNPAGKLENFAWLGWGDRRFSADELRPARLDLEAIAWTKFRHHFLRFNVTPGKLDWFDDHTAVVNNARLAAQVARAGRCQGIFLDTEAYQGKLFDYRKQRDVKTRSWEEYQKQARLRGREVMAAFQVGFPEITVFVTFGHSLIWKQSDGGKKPLADCADGLLVPFLDGMIDAAAGPAQLVDGHELSYGYREPALFGRARQVIKVKAAGLAADRRKFSNVVTAGFGLWLDYDWPKYGWSTTKIDSNYFGPVQFERSLRAAVDQTDVYVWVYSEKPRWWSGQGGPVNLPRPYIDAIQRVRSEMLKQ
jgi:hypothetical protein